MKDDGFTVWVTGPQPGAVDAIVDQVVRGLAARRVPVEVLDPRTPGIDAIAPTVRAATFVAALLERHGVVTVVGIPAPRRAERDRARTDLARLVEVHVRPLGDAAAPGYEPPERAEVEITVPEPAPGAGAERVLRTLEVLGWLHRDAEAAYSEEEEREVIRRLKAFGYL